jgi:beta-lactamase superfamily II metal-dependent hydrolase
VWNIGKELGNGLQPFQTTAIISVGKNNKFGHPTREVLERLEKFGVKIRRTDEEGEITVGLWRRRGGRGN